MKKFVKLTTAVVSMVMALTFVSCANGNTSNNGNENSNGNTSNNGNENSAELIRLDECVKPYDCLD